MRRYTVLRRRARLMWHNRENGYKRSGHARVSVIWGWQQYFAELAQFLTHTNRNLGLTDKDSSANIVERLQVRHMSRSRSHTSQWLLLFPDLCSKPNSYQAAFANHNRVEDSSPAIGRFD